MTNQHPYRTFSSWLRTRYGTRVYKVALNAGLGCPNRDGTFSAEGCLFCDEHGSGHAGAVASGQPLSEQFDRQVRTRQALDPGPYRFIAYLQAGTNTWGEAARLRSIYEQTRELPGIVAVSVATRPDCVGDEVLDLMAGVFDGLDVWVEMGVQTASDETLAAIGRNHDFAAVEKAVGRLQDRGFLVCAHAIIGLPGEGADQVRATARRLAELGVNGVKLHGLFVALGSRLEDLWRRGRFTPQPEERYVRLAVDFLERTRPDTVVQRLTGRGRPEVHLAPEWMLHPRETQQRIVEEFRRRGARQGALLDADDHG